MRKLALSVVIALIVVVSAVTLAHAQVYGPVFQVEYNTDRAGADIRSGFSANLGDCMTSCASTSECRSFTWVDVNEQPPNYSNSTPLCWLKNAVPGRRRNTGMVSGIKQ